MNTKKNCPYISRITLFSISLSSRSFEPLYSWNQNQKFIMSYEIFKQSLTYKVRTKKVVVCKQSQCIVWLVVSNCLSLWNFCWINVPDFKLYSKGKISVSNSSDTMILWVLIGYPERWCQTTLWKFAINLFTHGHTILANKV